MSYRHWNGCFAIIENAGTGSELPKVLGELTGTLTLTGTKIKKTTKTKSALGCGAWRTLFPLKIWRKGKKCVPLPSYYEKGNKK